MLVEYDRATANPWVPFPIPLDRARDLACAAGLAWEGVVAQRRSAYQGTLYCAVLSPVRTDSRAELETPS